MLSIFTPGPSQLYPTVYGHINTALAKNIGSISHRSKAFEEIFRTVSESLRILLHIPKTHHVFFISSALEAMERIPKRTELICIIHNETSTGVALDLKDIYTLKKQYPNIPIAMDIVSSAPYSDIDFHHIDMAFFSVQKGFGMPAGLGVMIINGEALEKAKSLQSRGISIGGYHSFSVLRKMADKFQTPETPNVLALYVFGKVCGDFLKKGIGVIRKQTDEKARILYDFFDAHEEYKPFIKEKKFRSPTTIEIEVQGKSDEIIKRLSKKGIIVGKGYGEFRDDHIRIANFPAHSVKEVKNLVENV